MKQIMYGIILEVEDDVDMFEMAEQIREKLIHDFPITETLTKEVDNEFILI